MIGMFASVLYCLFASPISEGERVPEIWEDLLSHKFLIFTSIFMILLTKEVMDKTPKANSWFAHILIYLIHFLIGASYFNIGLNLVNQRGYFWNFLQIFPKINSLQSF